MNKLILGVLALGIAASVALATRDVNVTVQPSDVKVGAVTNPDIASPYVSWGGVRNWAGGTSNLAQATTTVCAIQSPASTSTLQYATLKLSVSSTTASIVTIAKASSAFATTTALSRLAVGANAQALHFASTTEGSADQIFAPNQFVVFGMEGGTGTFSPTGVCQAGFREI